MQVMLSRLAWTRVQQLRAEKLRGQAQADARCHHSRQGSCRHRVPHAVRGQEHARPQPGELQKPPQAPRRPAAARGPPQSLRIIKVAQCSRHGQRAFDAPATDGAALVADALAFPRREGPVVLGAEGHGAGATQHRTGVTAVSQVQEARGDEQRHRSGASGLSTGPERAQALVGLQKSSAQRPAHTLGLAGFWAQLLKHMVRQVASAEVGGSRPAVVVEDEEENPAWGQPG